MLSIKQLKRMSAVTVLTFVFSLFAGYAAPVSGAILSLPTTSNTPDSSATRVTISADLSGLSAAIPQLTSLNSTLRTAEAAAATLENVATPIYNKVVPTNMDTMGLAERCKAIINNARSVLSDTLKSSTNSANQKVAQGASVVTGLEYDEKIAYGIQELGKQAEKLDNLANNTPSIAKLKAILASTKETLSKVVTNVRAKIFKVGQKVGLIDENKVFEDGKVKDASESSSGGKIAAAGYAKSGSKTSFVDKLSSGVKDGVANAKTSLKNSFSVQNLAITTAVSVGTSLAVDCINGETPSLKKAVKQVASLEFAGNIVGSALGAAGGQVVSSVVKAFVPGIAGQLIGSVVPVMFSSAGGQLSSNLITGLKNGKFSVSDAFKAIDKADLVGSSIGSTIGMTLGAMIPVPVVGSILGGIVGGFVGSKVAKWVTGLFGKNKNNKTVANGMETAIDYKTGLTIGNGIAEGSELPVACGPSISASMDTTAGNVSGDANVLKALKEVENNYYQAYLEYNSLLASNNIEAAKEVFKKLKTYSDQYSALRKAIK